MGYLARTPIIIKPISLEAYKARDSDRDNFFRTETIV